MLDKTLPYFHVIMKRRAGLPIAMHVLPFGFSIAGFVAGDEVPWARIETSAGEFMTEGKLSRTFKRHIYPITMS